MHVVAHFKMSLLFFLISGKAEQILKQEIVTSSFFSESNRSSIKSELDFTTTTSSREAQNSVYNVTLTSPDEQYLVLVAGKIVEIVNKSESNNKCFVKPDNLSESIIKIAVGNKYLAVLRNVSVGYSYVISTFALDGCVWVGTHSRNASNANLLNISSTYYNLTGCSGDFKIYDNYGDSDDLIYGISFGCP